MTTEVINQTNTNINIDDNVDTNHTSRFTPDDIETVSKNVVKSINDMIDTEWIPSIDKFSDSVRTMIKDNVTKQFSELANTHLDLMPTKEFYEECIDRHSAYVDGTSDAHCKTIPPYHTRNNSYHININDRVQRFIDSATNAMKNCQTDEKVKKILQYHINVLNKLINNPADERIISHIDGSGSNHDSCDIYITDRARIIYGTRSDNNERGIRYMSHALPYKIPCDYIELLLALNAYTSTIEKHMTVYYLYKDGNPAEHLRSVFNRYLTRNMQYVSDQEATKHLLNVETDLEITKSELEIANDTITNLQNRKAEMADELKTANAELVQAKLRIKRLSQLQKRLKLENNNLMNKVIKLEGDDIDIDSNDSDDSDDSDNNDDAKTEAL